MPCYDPPLKHETRFPEFVSAALCYATSKLTPEELAGFPGLAEWRKRHEVIDASANPWKAASDYDGGNGYDAPTFMKEFMEAFPEPARRG